MEEELFTEELASIAELADRWNVTMHQLSYAARSRKIPHEKLIGTSRLFNIEQQRLLYGVFHKHLTDDAPIEGFRVVVPEITAQESLEASTMQWRLARLEEEHEALKGDHEMLQKNHEALQERHEALQARMVILERLVADVLGRRSP